MVECVMIARSNAKEAFTLVELLLVIAIIAVLAALLLSAVGRGKARAQRAVCTSNLRQISLGVRLYSDDSEDVPPGARTNALDPFSAFKRLMKNYVGLEGASSEHDRLFACPSDRFYYDYDERISQSLHRQAHSDFSSYAFNAGNVPPGAPPGAAPIHPWPGIAGRKLSSMGGYWSARTHKGLLLYPAPAPLPGNRS